MFKYDPLQKTVNDIESTFINGKKYLEDILDGLKPRNNKTSNQCILITGPRGIGKSHFLKALSLRISKDKLLKKYYFPTTYPEELFRVNSLYHFLIDVIKRIFEQMENLPKTEYKKSASLEKEFNDLCNIRFKVSRKDKFEQKKEIEDRFLDIINKLHTITGKKFILLLENLQQLFGNKLSRNELKRIRGYLQENPETMLIIGSAVTIFNTVEKYGEPFYNFFISRRLTGINKKEIVLFLKKQATVRNNPEIHKKVEKYKSEIEVFRILTGGNPRLVLFLYDLLLEKEELFTSDILKKLIELTPYFKDKTESLSPLKQIIMDELCKGRPAQTPSEIAKNINEPLIIVCETLKRLKTEGKIRIVNLITGGNIKSSETFYTVSDYFYRIWYQIRQSVNIEENISWMAELAVLLFNREQLQQKIKHGKGQLRMVYENALEKTQTSSYINNINFVKEIRESYIGSFCSDDKLFELFKNKKLGEKFNYKKAFNTYKTFIKSADIFQHFNIFAYKSVKNCSKLIFNEKESIDSLTNKNSSLKTKLSCVGHLILLNKFNGIENFAISVFEEVEKLQQGKIPFIEIKELCFYFMFETILRLNNDSGEKNPIISAQYFLKTSFLLQDKRSLQEKVFEFLINYLKNTQKSNINTKELMNIISEWEKMDIVLPESIIALFEALKNPDSRTAQVWSSDPLFKEIVKMISQS